MKNLKKLKVQNMVSSTGKKIANQSIIETEGGYYFRSYESIIAFKPKAELCKVVLDAKYWDYSPTTRKYRNIFLNEDKKTTERKLKGGRYILADLNK